MKEAKGSWRAAAPGSGPTNDHLNAVDKPCPLVGLSFLICKVGSLDETL